MKHEYIIQLKELLNLISKLNLPFRYIKLLNELLNKFIKNNNFILKNDLTNLFDVFNYLRDIDPIYFEIYDKEYQSLIDKIELFYYINLNSEDYDF